MSLSISDFQKIANGSHNAGDITLTSSGKLDKVNNHVGILKGWNTKTISATTTLEVKNAFVNALKNAGIGKAELAKVREELGLPKGGGTKGLDLSTLKPLSRAQAREILDRYANTINQNAHRTVVSNRWAALKAADDANYLAHVNLAAETNQRTGETRAAAMKALGQKILFSGKNGFNLIPSNIRKSIASTGLSLMDEQKFTKVFAGMLMHGGSDMDGIAAEAMKKILISKFGGFIKSEAERNLFKSIAVSLPATTDFARIREDILQAAETTRGAKLSFGKADRSMQETANMLVTNIGIGKVANNTSKVSTKDNFADNLAKNVLQDKKLLKEIIGKFGAQVKSLGTLELYGAPSYRIVTPKKDPNKRQIIFTFDTSIGGDNKTAKGQCQLMLEVDKATKTIDGSGAKMDLKPVSKFTAKDETPVELHKMNIIENAKKLAVDKGEAPLSDDEVKSMMDQMSKWEDIKPGQLKNFESWAKTDIANYINTSIGHGDLGGEKKPLEFNDDGVCVQFECDCYRGQFTIGTSNDDNATVYKATGNKNDAKPRCEHFCKVLTNKADRMFISGLMNQSTIATIAALNSDGVLDPDDHSENPPRVLGLEPEEGKHVPHWSMDNEADVLSIMQPNSNDGCRYELRVDDKNKTATLTITSDYEVKTSMHLRDGMMGQGKDAKIGLLVSSYEIQIAGLGSGNPYIDSVGFRQELEAVDKR
ncbi:MAG: hypothetical protein J6T51_05965 [Kiritimatiellae bacterium]|nr:hypothetical protein [Kiritimatiellia bacterium]